MLVFRKIFFIVAFLLFAVPRTSAQTTKFNASVYAINDYLVSARFYKLRLNEGELTAIDSLYAFALNYFDGNKSDALLSLTFSLLPFDKMELALPFGGNFSLYLPCTDYELYRMRLESLPRGFLPDSPTRPNADTDKLSHFFGNAFLGYDLNFFNFADFLGIFVEAFEYNFKIKGAFDLRDIRMNKLGLLFGDALKNGKKVSPSEFIALYSINYLELP